MGIGSERPQRTGRSLSIFRTVRTACHYRRQWLGIDLLVEISGEALSSARGTKAGECSDAVLSIGPAVLLSRVFPLDRLWCGAREIAKSRENRSSGLSQTDLDLGGLLTLDADRSIGESERCTQCGQYDCLCDCVGSLVFSLYDAVDRLRFKQILDRGSRRGKLLNDRLRSLSVHLLTPLRFSATLRRRLVSIRSVTDRRVVECAAQVASSSAISSQSHAAENLATCMSCICANQPSEDRSGHPAHLMVGRTFLPANSRTATVWATNPAADF